MSMASVLTGPPQRFCGGSSGPDGWRYDFSQARWEARHALVTYYATCRECSWRQSETEVAASEKHRTVIEWTVWASHSYNCPGASLDFWWLPRRPLTRGEAKRAARGQVVWRAEDVAALLEGIALVIGREQDGG